MENFSVSVFSGLGSVVNKLLGSPLDFLAGKACSSVCGPSWDLFCYIENFCVSHLLKLATVSVLLYFVLLFFYLICQLGICGCICRTIYRVVWVLFSTCFSILECCCTFLCYKLPKIRHIHRRRKSDIEDLNPSGTDEELEVLGDHRRHSDHLHHKMGEKRSAIRLGRNYKDRMRNSLRPKSHGVRVGIRDDPVPLKKRNSIQYGDQESSLAHGVKVTRTTNFAQKGGRHRHSTNKRQKK